MRNLVIMAAMLLCCSAQATIIQVASTAGMTQGSYTVEDFEDATFVTGASFASSSGVRRHSGDGVEHTGSWGLITNNAPDPISTNIALGGYASSIGMWFGNDDTCCSGGFTAYLDIYGSAGLIDTISVVANMNDSNDQFIGFISDELVSSVTIRYGTGSDVNLFHAIDDVMFNSVSVPESGTLALLGLGLASLVRMRRRVAG